MPKMGAGMKALVDSISQTDRVLAAQAARAVNVSLTLRNWFIGYYIAEYELRGADRAAYGEGLVPALAKALHVRKTSITGSRRLYAYFGFYRAYPAIVRTASALSVDTPVAPAESLLTRLSYSHFARLIDQNAGSKRRFYEIESLRGNWSVRELQRQIDTQYFERTSLSRNKIKHEHLGQLNVYVSYYRKHEMNIGDQPPIGILLCRGKNQELVEFALADLTNKLLVSKYQVQLPRKAQITAFLQKAMRELAP
jgi:DUF1016 N-terminal domain/YhcG PDDEXK nuclease domain